MDRQTIRVFVLHLPCFNVVGIALIATDALSVNV